MRSRAAVGSGFVEMFLGVGAARVRDLFQEARNTVRADGVAPTGAAGESTVNQ